MTRGENSSDGRCFVTHLECPETGECVEPGRPHGLSAAGSPLLVHYDLDALAAALNKEDLLHRAPDMWRYREFLPHGGPKAIVSLGEMMTPLIDLPRTAQRLGGAALWVKDEGRLPTSSFKARGLALAVTMAKSFGIERIAMPTAGNAGAALAAYAARAGIEAYVFTPEDTPDVTAREIAFHGAKVWRVDGLIDTCGRVVAGGTAAMNWFDLSTLKEPYRIEGKKTMGLELAEQMNWQLPDVIFYPTGGGTGLIAMEKAFRELKAIGWTTDPPPKLVAVQSTGCGPIVRAWEAGADHVAEPWTPVTTDVHGVRVPKPLGDKLILRALRQTEGFAVAVEDDAVTDMRARATADDGLHLGPEGAACLVAYEMSLASGRIARSDRAVVFNCGNGLKSPMPPLERRLSIEGPVDYAAL